MGCKECIRDLEGAGDDQHDENVLDAINGKNGKYQLKYKWMNDKLVKVEDGGDELKHGTLPTSSGHGDRSLLDPKFNPEYEIICDGFTVPERNMEPRNFTLSLSAIKANPNEASTRNGPSDFEMKDSIDPFRPSVPGQNLSKASPQLPQRGYPQGGYLPQTQSQFYGNQNFGGAVSQQPQAQYFTKSPQLQPESFQTQGVGLRTRHY